jgi:hypothetical protein
MLGSYSSILKLEKSFNVVKRVDEKGSATSDVYRRFGLEN